ncbi:MAG: hypothetical protein ACYTEV_11475 [Planctomycetota bacterium]
MPSPSPEFERVIDWLDGRLEPEEAAGMSRIVATDPVLTELAGLYHSARATVAGDRSEPPSEDLLARLKAIGRVVPVSEPARAPLLGRLAAAIEAAIADLAAVPRTVADLLHDSREPVAGLRGGGSSPGVAPLQSVWSDGSIEVELRIDPGSEPWTILGQVTGSDGTPPADAEVRLASFDATGSPRQQIAAVDADGVFETQVPAGDWGMVLVLPDRMVVLERLVPERG